MIYNHSTRRINILPQRSFTLKQFIFRFFRMIARIFSGSGLRDRFEFVNKVYKFFNRGLSPRNAVIHGHIMHLDKDDSMGLSINGEYEPIVTELVINLIKPDSVVLDIGANIGYFTLLFAKVVGASGHVYAFEPDPYSYQLLEKNIEENNYSNISTYQLAVSDQNSTLFLHRDQFNNLDHRIYKSAIKGDLIEIDAVSLDAFFPQISQSEFNFIKMDIQGSEGWAIEGMMDLINKSNEISILTEYWPEGLDKSGYGRTRFIHLLDELGFDLFDIIERRKELSPVKLDDVLAKYPEGYTGHTNLLCVKKEYNS